MKEINNITRILDDIINGVYFEKAHFAYYKRIFRNFLDSNLSSLRGDLYETGDMRRITKVEKDGVVTVDYAIYVEERHGNEIFSFSEREIDFIENLIAEDLENL
jgi:hypothetical protein